MSTKQENLPIELPPALRHRLGLALLVLYGTGITIGAGIHVLIGAVAGHAGVYAPRRPHRRYDAVRALAEKSAKRWPPHVLWIDPFGELCAALASQLSCASQRDVSRGAKADFSRLAVPAKQEHPASATIR